MNRFSGNIRHFKNMITSAGTGILLLGTVLALSDCSDSRRVEKQRVDEAKMKEHLVGAHKIMTRNESEEINSYIQRHGWVMDTTGTGLRYAIYKKGEGMQAATGKKVSVHYTLKLLSGDTVYSTEANKPFEFIIGQSEAPSGLHEGVALLRVGDKAKFILPSHLGYGLMGDQDKIPARAVLVYDLELVDVQ